MTTIGKQNLNLVQHVLGQLNESDTISAIAKEREREGISHNIFDLIHEKEVHMDWHRTSHQLGFVLGAVTYAIKTKSGTCMWPC